jgi:hypothetical protein
MHVHVIRISTLGLHFANLFYPRTAIFSPFSFTRSFIQFTYSSMISNSRGHTFYVDKNQVYYTICKRVDEILISKMVIGSELELLSHEL